MATRKFVSLLRSIRPELPYAPPSLPLLRRSVHTRPPLEYDLDEGLPPFLSPEALKTIAIDYQDGLLERLNDEVRGTDWENASVVGTVIGTASIRERIMAFNYASEALNNSFFLSALSTKPDRYTSPSPTRDLHRAITISSNLSTSTTNYGEPALPPNPFGSLAGLKSHFSAAAMGMVGSGWIWLVMDGRKNLGVLGTYGAGTVLVQSRQQRGVEFVLGEDESRKEGKGEGSKLGSSADVQSRTSSSSSGSNRNSPPSAARPFSTSAQVQSAYRPLGVQTNATQVGNDIYPLLNLSIHEHAWLRDYGVWGKEEYVRNFWEVVDWRVVQDRFDKYVRNLGGRNETGGPGRNALGYF